MYFFEWKIYSGLGYVIHVREEKNSDWFINYMPLLHFKHNMVHQV